MYEGILGVNLVEGVVCIEAALPFAGVTTQLQTTPLCEVSSLNHLWDGTEQVLEVLHSGEKEVKAKISSLKS